MNPWEAALWVGLAIFSPAVVRPAWPRAVSLLNLTESLQDLALRFAPWLWGFGPAYLALITGAIPPRFFGLSGHSPLSWFGGAIICGALIGIAALIEWPDGEWQTPTRSVLDEPRWALYRAAAILWIAEPSWGLLAGLGLGLLEWVIRKRLWAAPSNESLRDWWSTRAADQWQVGTWEHLLRLASSSLLFTLTRNFWLTTLSQAVLVGMIRRKTSQVW